MCLSLSGSIAHLRAAIDVPDLSVDPRAIIRGEERHGRRNVLRLPSAGVRNGLQAAFDIFVGQMLLHRFGQYKAGADHVRADALLAIFGGDVAGVAAIGMLSGFCGTLLTPMAANFNILPVALLTLNDRNAVIKAQAPTALIMLLANALLMYFLAFR